MKLDTPKACHTLGLMFFVAITVIEVFMFCNIFNAFGTTVIRLATIGLSTVVFNGAVVLIALAYYRTLQNLKDN